MGFPALGLHLLQPGGYTQMPGAGHDECYGDVSPTIVPKKRGSVGDTHFLISITSKSRFPFPVFHSKYGSSFGINITKPLETLTWLCGDFFSFTSSPLFMPTMRTSVPSTSGRKGAPGTRMQRVTNSFGRKSAAVSAVFVVPTFRR